MSLCEAELPAGIKPLHCFCFGLFVGFWFVDLVCFALLGYGEEEITRTDVYFTRLRNQRFWWALTPLPQPRPGRASAVLTSTQDMPREQWALPCWCVCECWKIPCTISLCFSYGPLRCHSFCMFCFPHISPPPFFFPQRESCDILSRFHPNTRRKANKYSANIKHSGVDSAFSNHHGSQGSPEESHVVRGR